MPPDKAGGARLTYLRLSGMAALCFAAMYVLMYAMVDRPANIHPSLNQAYMAGLMTAPMVVFELLLMRSMYRLRAWNLTILGASVAVGLGCFIGIREQAFIGDAEFLRSMIPHHAGAILMCGKAPVADAEIRALCGRIIEGQQAEIDQMNAILARSR